MIAKGDCLRRCLARLLRLPLRSVPDFVNRKGGTRWAYHLTQWGNRRGYAVIVAKTKVVLPLNVKAWINIGTTRRGTRHAVVMESASWQHEAACVYDGGNPLVRVDTILLVLPLREDRPSVTRRRATRTAPATR